MGKDKLEIRETCEFCEIEESIAFVQDLKAICAECYIKSIKDIGEVRALKKKIADILIKYK